MCAHTEKQVMAIFFLLSMLHELLSLQPMAMLSFLSVLSESEQEQNMREEIGGTVDSV